MRKKRRRSSLSWEPDRPQLWVHVQGCDYSLRGGHSYHNTSLSFEGIVSGQGQLDGLPVIIGPSLIPLIDFLTNLAIFASP